MSGLGWAVAGLGALIIIAALFIIYDAVNRSRYDEAVEHSYELAARRALAIGVFGGVASFVGYAAIALV